MTLTTGRIVAGITLAVAAAAGIAAGCFSPNIASGGFLCSDAGACPEGFRCSSVDHKCYKPDAGPEVRMCSDAAPLAPLCSDDPASGQACNPACQTGCMCNDRCTVSGGTTVCKVAGDKSVGDACDVNNDNCGRGLGCVRECGANLGRCFHFCRGDGDCPSGISCVAPSGGTFRTCDIQPQTCNPVGAEAGMTCPHSTLGCYVSSGSTLCDCKGTAPAGDPCTIFSSCLPGLQCLRAPGDSGFRCHEVCRTATDCAAPFTRCEQMTGGFGFCAS